MPQEDFTPQKAIIHGISTLMAMEKRDILGVVCLKSFHKLYFHTWLGRPFVFLKKTNDYKVISTFSKGFSAEFISVSGNINRCYRQIYTWFLHQIMFEAQYNKHKSTQRCMYWTHNANHGFWRLINKRLWNFYLVFLCWLPSEMISFDILGWIKCY